MPAKEAEEPVEPALPAVPTPSVSKPSPPAVPTPRTPSEPPHDSVYAYLLAELGTAEKRSRDLESDIQDLDHTLQAKDALLGGATARLEQVEKTVVELKAALQSERDMADRKLRQALAKADGEAETKRKRDVKEASEPVARLRSALDEVYEVSLVWGLPLASALTRLTAADELAGARFASNPAARRNFPAGELERPLQAAAHHLTSAYGCRRSSSLAWRRSASNPARRKRIFATARWMCSTLAASTTPPGQGQYSGQLCRPSPCR